MVSWLFNAGSPIKLPSAPRGDGWVLRLVHGSLPKTGFASPQSVTIRAYCFDPGGGCLPIPGLDGKDQADMIGRKLLNYLPLLVNGLFPSRFVLLGLPYGFFQDDL